MLKSARTKILIYLAVWQRPQITELCFKGIERLRKHPDFDIQVLAVISEPEMIGLCNVYGVAYCMHANLPLGAKKNYGLSVAKMMDFEYLMEIGSDDLITNDLLDDYKKYIGKHDFFGVGDVAYVNSRTGDCRRLVSKNTYGAGRMISRNALEKMDWKIWNDKLNCGLDNNSIFNFMRVNIGYKRVPEMETPGVIDVKSDVNIWKFNYLLGVDYDIEKILCKLSEDERETIIDLMYAEV